MEDLSYDEVMVRLAALRDQYKDGLITAEEWELEVTGILVQYSLHVRMVA